MSRKPKAAVSNVSHRVRAWRLFRNLTLEHVGAEISMSSQNLGRIERGEVPLSEKHHAPLAKAFGIQAIDLFRDPPEEGGRQAIGEGFVPIIGRVGANPDDRIVYTTADDAPAWAPLPPGGTAKAAAVEVVGHSMRWVAEDGSLIYFEQQRNPPSEDMLGDIVIVETDDDQVLVKRLLRGSKPKHFDLESQNGATLIDRRLRWAAEITAIVPPKQARRIIRRDLAA